MVAMGLVAGNLSNNPQPIKEKPMSHFIIFTWNEQESVRHIRDMNNADKAPQTQQGSFDVLKSWCLPKQLSIYCVLKAHPDSQFAVSSIRYASVTEDLSFSIVEPSRKKIVIVRLFTTPAICAQKDAGGSSPLSMPRTRKV